MPSYRLRTQPAVGRERKGSTTDTEKFEPSTTTGSKAANVYPSSMLVEGFDVSKWMTAVEDK